MDDKRTFYLESSFISYLTSDPSRDIVVSARQQASHEWWKKYSNNNELYLSDFVIEEISRGDSTVAQKRLQFVKDLPLLTTTEDVFRLAGRLLKDGPIPEKAEVDAYHIACAVVNGVDFLITWNFKHIANALIRHDIEQVCVSLGYEPTILCTPDELLEDEQNV